MSISVTSFPEVHQVLKPYIPTMGAQEAYRLERMEPLMERLGNPQQNFRAIHIAGTSGKTSTCYYTAALLRESGAKVGLTVSPHVDEINERVQINLEPLPEGLYCKLFTEFMDLLDGLTNKPTYFELLVAFAYWIFAKQKVDYAVIEVGLGGLLDSTNVITRPDKVCVLTDIGMDHTDLLGQTLPEITAQKAGIIRPHNTVFVYDQGDEVMGVVREVCDQQQAELHEIVPAPLVGQAGRLPLFQRRNLYLASKVAEYVLGQRGASLMGEQLAHASKVIVPGRMEVLEIRGRTIVLDGAHNPQKMSAFVYSLKNKFPNASFAVMLAMTRSKTARLEGSLRALQGVDPHLIITSLGDDQKGMQKASISPLKIAEQSHLLGYDNWQTIADPLDAFEALLSRPEDILVVTGSLYLLGYIRANLPTAL